MIQCIYIYICPCRHIQQKQQSSQRTATSPLTLDFCEICRNLSEIHRILSEVEGKMQASFIWKMRVQVDHGHVQLKIMTNRDESSFCRLKL